MFLNFVLNLGQVFSLKSKTFHLLLVITLAWKNQKFISVFSIAFGDGIKYTKSGVIQRMGIMTQLLPQCENLQEVKVYYSCCIMSQRCDQDIPSQSSLKNNFPTFRIVFAGAFSAGKSMLLNALLEREFALQCRGDMPRGRNATLLPNQTRKKSHPRFVKQKSENRQLPCVNGWN